MIVHSLNKIILMRRAKKPDSLVFFPLIEFITLQFFRNWIKPQIEQKFIRR